ncbi:hypothetical protein RRG08_028966 [Elysia crispata]|uniref:Uncharacterized protein n=1 Tax=Elysia crispata TaxID=231223 RepID=A0AAE1E3T5_9GAST|nr:hypothetical protein RRG08_028966 [Elysia crispata]
MLSVLLFSDEKWKPINLRAESEAQAEATRDLLELRAVSESDAWPRRSTLSSVQPDYKHGRLGVTFRLHQFLYSAAPDFKSPGQTESKKCKPRDHLTPFPISNFPGVFVSLDKDCD